ncbi:helix-turn-helix domain-containing protein [Candidatus Odyssella acanthamoebae]|uniref:helix-turn-helix domain-containing protein n=1 Tax=Candidatus Odyssella acanthamoebae TaxID=91604 RepID=UPI00068D88F5|nr:helix-turn-helix transcriptional regulator [Candidatus Paracaedibacter acanthamoebae]
MPQSKTVPIEVHMGLQLKKRREELNLTQRDLAKLMKVTPQLVSKYETGQGKILPNRLYDLCQILSVTPNFFFEGLNEISLTEEEQSIWLSCQNLKGEEIQLKVEELRGIIADVKVKER